MNLPTTASSTCSSNYMVLLGEGSGKTTLLWESLLYSADIQYENWSKWHNYWPIDHTLHDLILMAASHTSCSNTASYSKLFFCQTGIMRLAVPRLQNLSLDGCPIQTSILDNNLKGASLLVRRKLQCLHIPRLPRARIFYT